MEDDKGVEHDGRQMCCRYSSDHQAVNCNAARMRYTDDYLSITQCAAGNSPDSQFVESTVREYCTLV